MSKKNIILLAVLILIIGLVVLVASLPKKSNEPGSEGGTNFFSDLFNLVGLKNKNSDDGTPTKNIGGTPGGEEARGSLFKMSSMPVAGFGVLKREVYTYVAPPEVTDLASSTENDTRTNTLSVPETEYKLDVRYVTAENGSIYQYDIENGQEKKYSSSVLPYMYEAFFGKNASSIALRYISVNKPTIETFVRQLPEDLLGSDAEPEDKISGNFLPQNINDISISPDGMNMFYLLKISSGISGTVASLSGANKNQVFDSSYTEWLSQWPNKDLITVTTKPAAGIPGFMYGINPNIKDFKKILGGVNGLTTLTSPNGKLVLYSADDLNLYLYDTEENNSKNLNVRTLPEKCVWGALSDRVFCAVPQYINTDKYPDSWYQGEVSFIDSLEEVSLTGGLPITLTKEGEVIDPIDAIKLTLSEDGNFLFFMNKKDLYLWGLRLK